MPIYSYRCENCGHSQDLLQKMSDPVLVVCPSCGASSFRKQVTAAGFQLKGSGWYVSDFRNPPAKGADKGASEKDGSTPAAKSGDDKSAATVNSGANEKAASGTKDKAQSTGSSDTSSSSGDKSSASSAKTGSSSTSEST